MGQNVSKVRNAVRSPRSVIGNIDKELEKKTVAPRHPSTVKAYDELAQAYPQVKDELENRNVELHKRLETVRVDSLGAAPDKILKHGQKISHAMDGRLTYDEIEELFINRKVSPEVWTEHKIAETYKLDIKVAENLINNFRSFHIYKMEDVSEEKDYSDNLVPIEEQRQITESKSDDIKS